MLNTCFHACMQPHLMYTYMCTRTRTTSATLQHHTPLTLRKELL
jgi:hypothetical protein